jgi:hypothetical protein
MAIILTLFCFILLATFPGWHYEHDELTGSDIDVKPFPSRPVAQVAFACSLFAAMLALIVALWQHTATVAAGSVVMSMGYGNIANSIGTLAMILSWVGCSVLFVVAIGLYVMLVSMTVLDRLT